MKKLSAPLTFHDVDRSPQEMPADLPVPPCVPYNMFLASGQPRMKLSEGLLTLDPPPPVPPALAHTNALALHSLFLVNL
jgi:hypothetical protein